MRNKNCPFLSFRDALTSTCLLTMPIILKVEFQIRRSFHSARQNCLVVFHHCYYAILELWSFGKRYLTLTDLSGIFLLGHPKMAFLFPRLFCIFMFNLCPTVILRYLCQNCHFPNDHFCLFGYFKFLFHQCLTLQRVSVSSFLSLGS